MAGPTIIGKRVLPVVALAEPATTNTSSTALVVVPDNFPVKLTDAERSDLDVKLRQLDFMTIPAREIALLGHEEEAALHQVLDGFLSRIDRFDNPQLFTMLKKFGEEIEGQKLDQLADKIMGTKPGLLDSVLGFVQTKKGREAALERLMEETQKTLRGSTTTLVDVVHAMESELLSQQKGLIDEIDSMERLKDAYRTMFRKFVNSAALQAAFLARAQQEVAARTAQADLTDPAQKSEIDELTDKLQALESRALATEGVLTRLPADQIVIRQLQNAGLATLQESSTTATQQFASIKMTLLTLNSVMVTERVQRLGAQNAAINKNLLAVQQKAMGRVVTTAANAAGDSRLKQATQLQSIVKGTKDMLAIVDQGRVGNAQKFAQTRTMFDAARKDLLGLGQQVQPGKPLAR
jgi:hypothetical protein